MADAFNYQEWVNFRKPVPALAMTAFAERVKDGGVRSTDWVVPDLSPAGYRFKNWRTNYLAIAEVYDYVRASAEGLEKVCDG